VATCSNWDTIVDFTDITLTFLRATRHPGDTGADFTVSAGAGVY